MKNIKMFEEYSKTPVKDFFADKIDMKMVLYIEKVLTKYEDRGYSFDADVMILDSRRYIYDMQRGRFYDGEDLNIGQIVGEYENSELVYTVYTNTQDIYDELLEEFRGKYKSVELVDVETKASSNLSFYEDDDSLLCIKK